MESLDLNKLSDYHLFEIIRNEKLDPNIRKAANSIFNNRKLSTDQIRQLEAKHDSLFIADQQKGLRLYQKVLLVICPLFIEIHSLIAGRMLAKGQKQKWKDYWLFLCLGFLVWTIAIILFAKFILFKDRLK